ncbi:MAG: hypothetical protein IKB16_16105 [Lentisphaeria bacterium]|nr:hypothetical protein [Lentisphaeria bacterium]
MTFKTGLILCFLLMISSAGWSQILIFDYKNAITSPIYQGNRAIDKLCKIADICIPAHPANNKSWNVIATLDEQAGRSEFSAFLNRMTNQLHIFYPANFYEWHNDPVSMRRLAAWVFLAKLGQDPLLENQICGHWIIRAAARKTMQTLNRPFVPFVQEYPITYVLAANGIFPDKNLPVNNDPPGTPDSLRQLNDEYAEMLLDFIEKAGLFRNKNNLAAHLLLSALNEQSIDLLTELPADTLGADPMSWFKQNMAKKLLVFYAPVSAGNFESQYWEITELHWKDKKGKIRKNTLSSIHSCLQEKARFLPALRRMQEQLWNLGKQAHPGIQSAMAALRLEISAVIRGTSDGKKLADLEKVLLEKNQEIMTIEQYTEQAQKQFVQPGARLKHLLQAVRSFRQHENIYPGAKEVLDKWDDYQ